MDHADGVTWWPGEALGRRTEARWWASLAFGVALILLGLVLFCGLALAGQYNNCGQTVGASAAAVPFPASGATGPASPTTALEICNAHATNTLGLNWTGGTASIGAQGTLTLNPGGCKWWLARDEPVPSAVSVIGSGANTVTACGYN